MAQRVPGPTVNLIAKRANEYGVYVAFGMVTKERVESVLYNSAIMIGPEGDLVEIYNKVHLRGEERMAFREGFKLPVIDTEFGSIRSDDRLRSGVPGSGTRDGAGRRGDYLRAGELGSVEYRRMEDVSAGARL